MKNNFSFDLLFLKSCTGIRNDINDTFLPRENSSSGESSRGGLCSVLYKYSCGCIDDDIVTFYHSTVFLLKGEARTLTSPFLIPKEALVDTSTTTSSTSTTRILSSWGDVVCPHLPIFLKENMSSSLEYLLKKQSKVLLINPIKLHLFEFYTLLPLDEIFGSIQSTDSTESIVDEFLDSQYTFECGSSSPLKNKCLSPRVCQDILREIYEYFNYS